MSLDITITLSDEDLQKFQESIDSGIDAVEGSKTRPKLNWLPTNSFRKLDQPIYPFSFLIDWPIYRY
jgi:DNA polymerase III sliding clamp (beta) subunit (PCNA family)